MRRSSCDAQAGRQIGTAEHWESAHIAAALHRTGSAQAQRAALPPSPLPLALEMRPVACPLALSIAANSSSTSAWDAEKGAARHGCRVRHCGCERHSGTPATCTSPSRSPASARVITQARTGGAPRASTWYGRHAGKHASRRVDDCGQAAHLQADLRHVHVLLDLALHAGQPGGGRQSMQQHETLFMLPITQKALALRYAHPPCHRR